MVAARAPELLALAAEPIVDYLKGNPDAFVADLDVRPRDQVRDLPPRLTAERTQFVARFAEVLQFVLALRDSNHFRLDVVTHSAKDMRSLSRADTSATNAFVSPYEEIIGAR